VGLFGFHLVSFKLFQTDFVDLTALDVSFLPARSTISRLWMYSRLEIASLTWVSVGQVWREVRMMKFLTFGPQEDM
jgi:hypothetical protein